MTSGLFEKRILIVGDDEMLCWAIELNLDVDAQVTRFVPGGNPLANPVRARDYDLVIAVVILPNSSSTLMLTLTAMMRQVGPVPESLPVLVISDRPFCSTPSQGICYLEFPFDIEELQDRVKGLVQNRLSLDSSCNSPESSSVARPDAPKLDCLTVEV